jgi:hypothetical protein
VVTLDVKGENAASKSAESLQLRSTVLSVCERLSEHCGKVRVLLDGFEASQVNNEAFNFNQPCNLSESSLTKATLIDVVGTYEALRHDVREITQVGYVDFELLFPKLDINFETYYSVAVSLLNLIYQMQLMRLYCYRLLKF